MNTNKETFIKSDEQKKIEHQLICATYSWKSDKKEIKRLKKLLKDCVKKNL